MARLARTTTGKLPVPITCSFHVPIHSTISLSNGLISSEILSVRT